MKHLTMAVIAVLVSATSVNADHHHNAWAKFFAGSWELFGEGIKAEMNLKAVAKDSAVIGTGKDAEGRESARIMGWDSVAERAIHAWFGDQGEHGRVIYEVVDKDTLRGPGLSRSSEGVMKGTVTLKRTSDNRYTVKWTNVTIDGEQADDLNIVVERLAKKK